MGQSQSKRWTPVKCCACVTGQTLRSQTKVDDSHKTQTSSWLPPRENWQETTGLPYGWETALDGNNKPYFINHVDKYTTRDDPRQDPDYVEPPRPREVELVRDQEKGFGFVAGSEKPVVVRFVTEGGPSVDKLLPGDLILKINGEEVRRAPREKVIELVRSCRNAIVLTVCQPYSDNSSRKSAILTAAKKAKLKNNPSRVRFADAIMVNGASVASQQSPQESYMPFMPNVLKVFLENGQTKSFKYDNKTTVKDVVHSLQEKLNITCGHHFSLVLQNMKSNVPGKMTLLQEHESLAELAARPGARHFRCLFRVSFVPHDAYDLLKEDPIAFEYFYMQCCNDVIHERFASEMKYDTALRLAALQIQQHAMSSNMTGKISIKSIEKESGLDKFVAHSLMENMKLKDLRKMLAQYMKMNQSLTAPGQKQLSALQAKLHYMKIISELKTFGSRVFMVTLLDQKSEAMVLVGPKAGVSVVTNIKSYTLTQLADFNQIENIKVTKDGENMHRVDISVKTNNKMETFGLGLLMEDAQNFVSMVVGYYHIFVDRDRRILEKTLGKNTTDPNVPSYEAQHRVLPTPWAYPEDLVSEVIEPGHGGSGTEDERIIDLSQDPPQYEKDEEYLAKIKQELGVKAPPTTFETTGLSVTKALPGRISNGQLFEEGVTSFGRTASSVDDSSSLDSSESSQGVIFKTVVNVSNNISHVNVVTDDTTSYPAKDSQTQVVLTTFKVDTSDHKGNLGFPAPLEISKSVQLTKSESSAINKTAPIETVYTEELSSFNTSDLRHDQKEHSLSDNTSSTSSSSANEASESQALLADRHFKEERSPIQFSEHGTTMISGTKMNDGMDADSDNSDNLGTPQDSPAKSRQLSRNSSIDLALQSFGLHSPDTVPGADVDFQNLDDNIQVTGNGAVETYNKAYSSQGYIGQRLYYDPDIIDLTNFPPPETPDDDSILDFTESSFPPPVFSSSNSSLSPWNKNDSARPMALPSRSSSTPSRLERSASTGNCPDFLDDDIDALIAQFTIPPPPSLSDVTSESHTLNGSSSQTQTAGNNKLSSDVAVDNISDDLAHLIVPPPPTNIANSPQVEHILIVPPVPASLAAQKNGEKSVKKHFIGHKRASSLDVNILRSSKDQFDPKNRSFSMDDNKNTIDAMSKAAQSSGLSEETSCDSTNEITGDSPALVSQKLHSLLQSLPTFAKELNQKSDANDIVGINSHHIRRSSSIDLNFAQTKISHRATSNGVAEKTDQDPSSIFSRSSSLRLKWSPIRPRSQSCEPGPSVSFQSTRQSSEILTNPSGTSIKSNSVKDLDKSSSGSESFASMKAKLKDYRDFLLSKSKSSASKKYIIDADTTQISDTGRELPQRSGSFSKLLSQFNRRGSKSDEHASITLSSVDANWELKEAKPTSLQQANIEKLMPAEHGVEKRVPVVRDALSLNRPTLRPLSNTLNQAINEENEQNQKNEKNNKKADDKVEEIETRKNGPIKALQPVKAGSENRSSNSKMALSKSLSQDSGRSSRHQKYTQMSKDDILMTHSQSKEKVKVNPYATIKMWRPTSIDGASAKDVYQSFTNFDALRHNTDSDWNARKGKMPPTGDRNTFRPELSYHGSQHGQKELDYKNAQSQGHINSDTDLPNHRSGDWHGVSSLNGFDELPADYSRDNSPSPLIRRVSFRDDISIDLSLTNDTIFDNSSKHSANMPSSPSLHPSSHSSSFTSPQPPPLPSSPNASKKEHCDTSFQVVSDGATSSVKLVLSHRYTDIDLVGKDVERLLAELRLTMDSLKTSRVDSNISHLSTCLSELLSQTKQFIQEAKLVVSSANNSHEKMMLQIESAVHILAHVFLHGQATMLLMTSPDHALQLGFQIIKAATSFKSTISAASLALGKTLNDPNMKYLMRLAHNLASLLASLVNTIKEVHIE